jgi:hypothetical protein
VSDLVSSKQGEAYGNFDLFAQRTDTVMSELLHVLPAWLNHIEDKLKE